MRSLAIPATLLLCCLTAAAQVPPQAYAGRSVVSVIEEFRSQGYPFAYSSNLVGGELRVVIEPEAAEAIGIVREILAPHGLALRSEEGLWLIVRDAAVPGRPGSLLIVGGIALAATA